MGGSSMHDSSQVVLKQYEFQCRLPGKTGRGRARVNYAERPAIGTAKYNDFDIASALTHHCLVIDSSLPSSLTHLSDRHGQV